MIGKLYTTAALEHPLDLFGQMLAQAPFAVWVADRDGRVLLFNEAMKRLVGIDDPERVLESYNIFRDPVAKTQGLIPSIRKVLKGEVVQTVVMLDLAQEPFGASGKAFPKSFYVRSRYFPLEGGHGTPDYVVVVIEDITRDYREDLELSRTARELETANTEILGREKDIIALKSRVRLLTAQLTALREHL